MAYGDQDSNAGSPGPSYQGPPVSAAFAQQDPAMMAAFRDAIAKIESAGSGDYNAIGPQTSKGDQAYGRYQVMGANIPSWTQQALGKSMTPQEFLKDQNAQDTVFNHQWGQNLAKYGNANDAASAWFTGRPLSQGGNSSDVNGVTGNKYVDNFNRALAGLSSKPANAAFAAANTDGQSDLPSAGAAPVSGSQTPAMVAAMQGGNAPQSGMPQEPQTMWEKFKDGGPGALFGLPSQHPWDLGSALQGIGIAGMAINNPAGANAMAQVPAMEARMNQPKWSFTGYNQDTGTVGVGNTRTGQFGVVHPPGAVPYQKIDGSAIQDFYGRDADIASRSNIYNQMADARDKLISGQYDVSKYKNYIADWHNLTNSSDPNDQFIGQVGHLLYLKQQEAAALQKGSNSDKRAGMELQSIIPDGLHNDNAQVAQAFNNVLQSERTKLNSSIEAQRGDLSRPGAQMQMPKGRWDDPSYYGGIQQSMNDKEAEFQPKYAKFKSDGAATTAPASNIQGAGNMSGTAAPSGSTGNTGGSLLKSFDTLGLKRKQ